LVALNIAINTVGKVFAPTQSWKTSEDEFDSMLDINAKTSLFRYQKKAGKQSPRQGKIISLVTSLLAALNRCYSHMRRQGPGEHFITRAPPKNFHPVPLVTPSTSPHGYTLLLCQNT